MFIPETQVILTFGRRIGAVRGKIVISYASQRIV